MAMNKLWMGIALMALWGSEESRAAREEHTFQVALSVPSRPFYVIPSESDWIHRPQRLDWDPVSSTLGSLRKHFDVRNDTSAIEARLEGSPYLSTGKVDELIQLHVFFNGVQVPASTPSREVVSREMAAGGARVLLEIKPVNIGGVYKPGDYSGTVNLVFNAKSPGE